MALRTFIIGIFIFVSIVVFVDCTATMLINNDPVEENPLLQVTGYLIYDLAAMLVWLGRIFFEAGLWLFSLGNYGDPWSAMMIVFQCAISFLYHLVSFGLYLICMPSAILNGLAVMFFDMLGLGTSYDEDGEKYVAFKNVPAFGLATEGIALVLTGIHNSVIFILGDPDNHEGGIYEITEFSLCSPRACSPKLCAPYVGCTDSWCAPKYCISIGDILDFCNIYWILDDAVSGVTDITRTLKESWNDFRDCEIFPFDFIDVFLEKVVGFVLDNVFSWILVEDTYDLYWQGLGLPTPDTWLNQEYAVPSGDGDGDAGDCPLCDLVDHN